MEILGCSRTMKVGTEKSHCKETPSGEREETPASVELLTIDIETVPVQGEILQLSTILGQTQEFLIDDNLVWTPSQKCEVTLSVYPSVVAWRDRPGRT